MRTFMRLLTTVALLTPLTACDQGDDSITPAPERPAVGAVAGTVSVEGEGVSGITVQLGGTASASTTTGANGAYSFPDVVEGNYSVMIGTIPADYAFAATTQNVTIRTTGQVATADFNGAWVRTASVLVQVQRGDGSPVATSVNLRGEDVDQTLSTDAQGTMLFTALKRGEYTARASISRRRSCRSRRPRRRRSTSWASASCCRRR